MGGNKEKFLALAEIQRVDAGAVHRIIFAVKDAGLTYKRLHHDERARTFEIDFAPTVTKAQLDQFIQQHSSCLSCSNMRPVFWGNRLNRIRVERITIDLARQAEKNARKS